MGVIETVAAISAFLIAPLLFLAGLFGLFWPRLSVLHITSRRRALLAMTVALVFFITWAVVVTLVEERRLAKLKTRDIPAYLERLRSQRPDRYLREAELVDPVGYEEEKKRRTLEAARRDREAEEAARRKAEKQEAAEEAERQKKEQDEQAKADEIAIRIVKSEKEWGKVDSVYVRTEGGASAYSDCEELAWPRRQMVERYGALPTLRRVPSAPPWLLEKIRGGLPRDPKDVLTPAEFAEFNASIERDLQEGRRFNKELRDWVVRTEEARKAEHDYPDRLLNLA